jgi:hypothetical protein
LPMEVAMMARVLTAGARSVAGASDPCRSGAAAGTIWSLMLTVVGAYRVG